MSRPYSTLLCTMILLGMWELGSVLVVVLVGDDSIQNNVHFLDLTNVRVHPKMSSFFKRKYHISTTWCWWLYMYIHTPMAGVSHTKEQHVHLQHHTLVSTVYTTAPGPSNSPSARQVTPACHWQVYIHTSPTCAGPNYFFNSTIIFI